MNLKEKLLSHGYDHIDILMIDENQNQSTVADISLHKVTNLEFKLYLKPGTVEYHLKEEHPFFEAEQNNVEGDEKKVKGFILEW